MEGVKVINQPTKQPWGGFQSLYESHEGTRFSVMQEMPVEQQETPKKDKKGICHLDIPCEDTERAKLFFEKTFGWTIITTHLPGYYLFQTNDKEFPLAGGVYKETEKSNRFGHPHLYLDCPDIEEELKSIKSHGGEVVKEKYPIPGVGFSASFKDTEGNHWALWSKK